MTAADHYGGDATPNHRSAPKSSMAKIKHKLTPAQKRARKAAKEERQRKFETVFIHGKQVRVRREPTVDGIPVDRFIAENADPIWLHQHGLWELIPVEKPLPNPGLPAGPGTPDDDDDIPF